MAMSTEITPIVLCGGSGTRLWPLSRKSYPKQFVPLVGDETLFQASLRRLESGDDLSFAKPIVMTGADFRFIVAEQMMEAGVDPGAVLLEPEGCNTAPAVLASVLHAAKTNPDAVCLVAPSDHVLRDVSAFREAVKAGLDAAERGSLVTFGVPPTHPSTAFGYIEVDGKAVPGVATNVSRFVEKPDRETAAQLLKAGNYLWNAGMFLFRARDILAAFDAHASDLVAPVTQAVEQATEDLGFLRLSPESWSNVASISLDYAVMEKAPNIATVPFEGGWSDLGGWDAVWHEGPSDEAGVVTSGPATAIDCSNVLLRSEAENLEVVGIGLENIFAVATPDAVLIAGLDRAQDVKLAVEALKAKSALQAETFPRVHRPWGWFESLVIGDRFQVKKITVQPGKTLSLQSHHHRAEHWVVVSGTAQVTLGDDQQFVTENERVYIPVGAKHRLSNPGKLPVVLIEVQTGAYVGEDDIVRHEDDYARK